MELSTALNQLSSELLVWRQETVLTIRKAFTFDDIKRGIEEPLPILDTGFVPAIKDDEYGFYRVDAWILAYPDVKTHQIVVSKHLDGKTSKTRINTFMTVQQPKPNPEGQLRREIIEFLALVKLKATPIDW